MANTVVLVAGNVSAEDLTTTASTVDTITCPDDWDGVSVQGSAAVGVNLYYTLDNSAPTVGGHNTFELIGAGVGVIVKSQEHNFQQNLGTTIKLISGGAFTYSVNRES